METVLSLTIVKTLVIYVCVVWQSKERQIQKHQQDARFFFSASDSQRLAERSTFVKRQDMTRLVLGR
jgi:hypothetical protein